jgi:hypothetical protein
MSIGNGRENFKSCVVILHRDVTIYSYTLMMESVCSFERCQFPPHYMALHTRRKQSSYHYRVNLKSHGNLSLLHSAQTASEIHTTSISSGYRGLLPHGKIVGMFSQSHFHLVSNFKKLWSHTSIPFYMSFITGVVKVKKKRVKPSLCLTN